MNLRIKNVISHGFECCYEWKEVMEQMLLATEDFEDIDKFENKSEENLQRWLGTFRGWGLLSSMLPSTAQYFFISQLTKARRNWSRQEMFTHQAAFEEVIARYEHGGKQLTSLIPDCRSQFYCCREIDHLIISTGSENYHRIRTSFG